MNIPIINLTDEQKLWISEILKYYLINKKPDEGKILLNNIDNFSPTFNSRDIDGHLYNNDPDKINIYGIYCLDPNHQFIRQINAIIIHIKNVLVKEKVIPRTFTSEELSKELDIPEPQVKVCLKLSSEYYGYFNGFSNPTKEEIGISSVTVDGRDSIQLFRRYELISSLLSLRLIPEQNQKKYIQEMIKDEKSKNLKEKHLKKSEVDFGHPPINDQLYRPVGRDIAFEALKVIDPVLRRGKAKPENVQKTFNAKIRANRYQNSILPIEGSRELGVLKTYYNKNSSTFAAASGKVKSKPPNGN
jgi:hypothetical protein